jgi:hypothetical protein
MIDRASEQISGGIGEQARETNFGSETHGKNSFIVC